MKKERRYFENVEVCEKTIIKYIASSNETWKYAT